MSVKLGDEMKLYYCADGIGGTPDWTELAVVRDVKLNQSKGEADASTRGGGRWKATVGTLKEAGIEFEVVWDTDDPGFVAFMDSYFADTLIGLAVTDGPIDESGTRVFKADCEVFQFNRNEPLEGIVTVNVTAKPTYSANQPSFSTVA